jgi:hypothetical protein
MLLSRNQNVGQNRNIRIATRSFGNVSQFGYFGTAVTNQDRLCGPVVRVLGYRSGGPGSIPGTTRKKK